MSARLRSNSHWMNLWVLGINTLGCNKSHEISLCSLVPANGTIFYPFSLQRSRYLKQLPLHFNFSSPFRSLSLSLFSFNSFLLSFLGKKRQTREIQVAISVHSLTRETDATVGIKPLECSYFRDARLPRHELFSLLFLLHLFLSFHPPRWTKDALRWSC